MSTQVAEPTTLESLSSLIREMQSEMVTKSDLEKHLAPMHEAISRSKEAILGLKNVDHHGGYNAFPRKWHALFETLQS